MPLKEFKPEYCKKIKYRKSFIFGARVMRAPFFLFYTMFTAY